MVGKSINFLVYHHLTSRSLSRTWSFRRLMEIVTARSTNQTSWVCSILEEHPKLFTSMALERVVLNDPEKFSSHGTSPGYHVYFTRKDSSRVTLSHTARRLAFNQVYSRRWQTSCLPRETRKANRPDQQTSITTTFQGSSYVGIK